jgi:hypothetical protein
MDFVQKHFTQSGRVEDGRGSLGPMANAPFPIPAHRTGRADFRHPALRLVSPWGTRGEIGRARVLRGRLRPFATRHSNLRRILSFDSVRRLSANHLDLSIFESTPEARVLPSAGITQLHWSYDPIRLPPEPPPSATLRPLPSPMTGLPRLPEPPFRRAAPTTPADQTGARVDCFPAHTAFPKWPEGRHPRCHFRDAMGAAARR